MSTKMKLLPAFLTLLAGSITSIITFCLDYEGKAALFILLAVLLLFYLLGTILQKVILTFEKGNDLEQQKKEEEEGKVIEKDTVKGDTKTEQTQENMTDKEEVSQESQK